MKIKLSKVEFILMLNRADTDKDGQISYKEFVVMMISDKNI
jgi:Ca2+-binding EF-hand superfamily protein